MLRNKSNSIYLFIVILYNMDSMFCKMPLRFGLFFAFFILLLFTACDEKQEKAVVILVDSVNIEGGNQFLSEGSSIPLTVTVTPEGAHNREVEWSSDNENTATVDEEGNVTAVSVGSAVITAAAKDGSGKSHTVKITVIYPYSGDTQIPFRWTFQEQIPGWTSSTEMRTDAPYQNGMTLLGSRHRMRWLPEQTTTAGNVSKGCIQTTGNAAAFIEIVNVQGPFKVTFYYTNTTAITDVRHPVLYVNGNKVKDGDPVALTNGANTRRILEYNYFNNEMVDVQLGSVGAFRLYDVFLDIVTDTPVDSVTINGGDFSTTAGAVKQLAVTVLPAGATNKNVVWSSSDESIAAVSSTGLVTAVSGGTAVITAKARDDSGVSGSITANVSFVDIESIAIAGGNFSLIAGYTKQLTPNILPANASNSSLTWSSSNTDVATVSQTGLVTGVNNGTAVITATAKDSSGVSGSVTATVTFIPVESVTIAGGNFSIAEGNPDRLLSVSVLPANASNKTLTWSSSNTNTATVSIAGTLTFRAAGQAVITASANDYSGKSSSITVTVTAPAGSMTPQEIFNSLKNQKVITYGWADMANDGAGLSYANPAALTLIDDASYPTALAKYWAFIDANFSSRPTVNASTGVLSGGTLNDNSKFIIISGDIDLSGGRINDNDKSFYDQFGPAPNYNRVNGDIILNLGSNTTIIGINNARIKFGGIRINNKTNVIIRNITFWDAHGSTSQDTRYFYDSKAGIDGLVIQGTSNGVWVDHCKFTDGTCNDMVRNFNHDGALDIPEGRNVTVSWTEFTNHDKVMLVAGSDSADNAIAERRQITLHHNYFHATTQRMPRTRGTQMHVYNNYYNNIGVDGNNGAFMGPGWGAQFIVENNYFGSKLGSKNIEWFDTNVLYPVKFYYAGNNIADTNIPWWGGRASDPKPWEPAYMYTLDNNAGLPSAIPGKAGPTLVFNK